MTTQQIREHYLIESLFHRSQCRLTYSHNDRVIVGGAMPTTQGLSLNEHLSASLRCSEALERRELGAINIGGPGIVRTSTEEWPIAHLESLYLSAGTRDVQFFSSDPLQPAKFYLFSTPAHCAKSSRKITQKDAQCRRLGAEASSNLRTIYQYIVPDVVETCQLTMGMTVLEPGSVWNTMPCHTHERRMETYFYFDLPEDQAVVHFMGQATETRHIFVRNEQAILSPSWSIHSGVGTNAYSFIWSMAGENQTFDDMDHIQTIELR